MTFSNIPRLILSVSGLFVGLLILSVGSILMDTYYNELKIKVEEYSDSSIVLNVKADKQCMGAKIHFFYNFQREVCVGAGNDVWNTIFSCCIRRNTS